MKSPLKNLDYPSLCKYLLVFFLFAVFNCLELNVMPYSTAILGAVLSEGCGIIVSSLLFISSFLVSGKVGLLGSASVSAIMLAIIFAIHRKTKTPAKYATCIYVAVSLLGFIFLGDTKEQIETEKRVLTAILTIALSFFSVTGIHAVNNKGLKHKFGFEEKASLAILVALAGVGVCNLISPLFWKALSVLILLTICFIYRTGIATMVSALLGVSLAIYYGNLSFVAVYVLWAVCAESLTPLSRYLSAIAVLVADYAVQVLFGVFTTYTLSDFLSVVSGVILFCIIPSKPLKALKERLYSFREKQLVRQTINRNRIMLAGRLYDLSSVFAEMANAFNLFNHNQLNADAVKNAMEKEIITSVCKECENHVRCEKHLKKVGLGIGKMLDIGFAKGKLSLIDMPKEVGDVCLRPNNLLYSVNKLLADYRAFTLEQTNVQNGRSLIASEALGVAEILRALALESGALLKYQSRLERTLSDTLFKGGISISELLVFGEEDNLSVSLIVTMKEFSIDTITRLLSKALGIEMFLSERAEVCEEKCYLFFKRAAPYDAVFGLSRMVKEGSPASGDTHSVTRISGDKFLVALADGMGSGESARAISSASLSLIESFYKAGLDSPLILNTVNKLLSINTEDNFTALDVSVINLKDCSADFIKYGSPYGFIVGDNGVRIIEGCSLPLGIIEELKPSVCHAQLNGGDMLVLITDGVSDAFGSSGEVIDFLRTVPAKNPQTLADELLSRALTLSGGQKKDDMTVLAVRIFKRKSA